MGVWVGGVEDTINGSGAWLINLTIAQLIVQCRMGGWGETLVDHVMTLEFRLFSCCHYFPFCYYYFLNHILTQETSHARDLCYLLH